MLQESINEAINQELFTRPTEFWMPADAPLKFAACAISLPPGCAVVDSKVSHRISTGAGFSSNRAAFIACMEAAERYSIQYYNDAPRSFWPFESSKPRPSEVDAILVLIGKPGNVHDVTTIGCAAGKDLQSAAQRACFEMLEHHFYQRAIDSRLDLISCDPCSLPSVGQLCVWLGDQLRVLRILVAKNADLCFFAIASCSDFDQGRRTIGTGCSTSADEAAFSASCEAILNWRNMIELERNGKKIDDFLPREQEEIRRYRGSVDDLVLTDNAELAEAQKFESCEDLGLERTLELAEEVVGQAISLVDLTHPVVGIPVVRAYSHSM